jgi:serine protease Do
VSYDVLTIAIAELRDRRGRPSGYLGVDVQPLTPSIAVATGSTGGIVVTGVDSQATAAGELVPGDVIEEADGERVTTESWAVRAARVAAGETFRLRVRRRSDMREVTLIADTAHEPVAETTLGLTLRSGSGVGSEVLRVVPATAAARAGVAPGDVITQAGDVSAPTPAQVRSAYAEDRERRGVLLALTRGSSHHVVVLRQ